MHMYIKKVIYFQMGREIYKSFQPKCAHLKKDVLKCIHPYLYFRGHENMTLCIINIRKIINIDKLSSTLFHILRPIVNLLIILLSPLKYLQNFLYITSKDFLINF
jgi:hypothetical protein